MIYGSAYTTARFIKESYPEIQKVRVVGMNSIRKELELQGIEHEGGEDDPGWGSASDPMKMEEFETYPLDPKVQAVVVGLDTQFTYGKLSIASLYINTGGARFIATNDDAFDMVNGRLQPGAGAMVSAIQYTLDQTKLGRDRCTPQVLGKPNPYAIELICKEHNITDRSR